MQDMATPSKLYWVEFHKGDGPPVRYGERGGGKYTSEKQALNRIKQLRKRGNQAFLLESDLNFRMRTDV